MCSLTPRSQLRLLKWAGEDGISACLCPGAACELPQHHAGAHCLLALRHLILFSSWKWDSSQVLLFPSLSGAFKCECHGRWGFKHVPRKMGAHESSFLQVYKQLYAQVKLGLFHMAFERLVGYTTVPALKANSFCFSLLSFVAHWLLSNLSYSIMDQGSKALPSSIRGLAYLMRLVLVGRRACAGALQWVAEVSSHLPSSPLPPCWLVLPGSAGRTAPYCSADL